MIRYSHVRLIIRCAAGSADDVTQLLGVEPSVVNESRTQSRRNDDTWQEVTNDYWTLDSPMAQSEGDPTARLYALADVIDPFAWRMPRLRPQFRPWIDILYHTTPQHSHGVSGEFDWFRMPAELMRRFGDWDLDVSYESMWFDHPAWVRPPRQSWWHSILRSFVASKQRRGNNLID